MIENRLTWARVRRLIALATVSSLAGTSPAVAAGAAAAGGKAARPPSGPTAPAEESLSERRAVRGVPVDDVVVPETPELRELRRFEEQAFPRAGAPRPTAAADSA